MTDELLGELAARMKLIADALPQHKLSALQALGLGRECLRQMRYAHSRWPEDAYPDSGSETLAPEDWTP
jgi:hypothetical protein